MTIDMIWVVMTPTDVLLFDDELLARSMKSSIKVGEPTLLNVSTGLWKVIAEKLDGCKYHVVDFRGHKLEWTSDEPPQRTPPEVFNQAREQLRQDIISLFPDVPRELLQEGPPVTITANEEQKTIKLQRIIPVGGGETALEIWFCKPPAPTHYYRVTEDDWTIVGDIEYEDGPHYGKQYTFVRDIYAVDSYEDAADVVDTTQLHHGMELVPAALCDGIGLPTDHNAHLHVAADGLKWCWSTYDRQPYQMDGYIGYGADAYRSVVQAIRTERRHTRTNDRPVYADFIRPASQVREIWFCPQPDQYRVSRDVWDKHTFAMPMYNAIRYVYKAEELPDYTQSISQMALFDGETVIKEHCAKKMNAHDPHVWVNKDYLVGRYRWCDGAQMNTMQDFAADRLSAVNEHLERNRDQINEHIMAGMDDEQDNDAEDLFPKPKPKFTRVVRTSGKPTIEAWWCEPASSAVYKVTEEEWNSVETMVDGTIKTISVRNVRAVMPVHLSMDQVDALINPNSVVKKVERMVQTSTANTGSIDDPYMEAGVLIREMAHDRRLSYDLNIGSYSAFRELVNWAASKLRYLHTANDIIDGYTSAQKVVTSFWHNESELANQFSKMPAENVTDILMLVIGLFYEVLMPGWNATTRELNSIQCKGAGMQPDVAGPADEIYEDDEEDDD